ncbi:Threonine aldolase [Dissophora globulifera]|uniref:Threonine aldolase n=1 Tax=Dissophora globulifera TaxID=979702 RepID=A0A9P6RVH6_9FUNG|nr:Threonine aldolase [Dissophora globulifera]
MQKSTENINPLPYADLRSDTATAPTLDMFAAMMQSSLGDDVYNEDDSVKALERYVATLCGHDAALYCSSGTMTNQLANRVHLSNPPQSALVDIRSHVFNYEAGGISFHSQAAVYPIMPNNGQYLTAEDIEPRLVFDVDIHYAPTRCISLENTLNGTIMPVDEIARIRRLTQPHGIKLHLDGARLWHASVATGVSMREYCGHFDTISLCLSKGIGAPIGSILVGNTEVIKKARHFRLLFGGGWRQAGFLAEAALYCIKTNWPTMRDTHRQAQWLERAFRQVGCNITNPVDTNMIWVDTTDAGFTVEELIAELAKENIKISGSGFAARIVLHYQVSDEVVGRFMDVLRKLATTQRMKIEIDLTKASLGEQTLNHSDGSESDESDVSYSTPAPHSLTPSPKKSILWTRRADTDLNKERGEGIDDIQGRDHDNDDEADNEVYEDYHDMDSPLPNRIMQDAPQANQWCYFEQESTPSPTEVVAVGSSGKAVSQTLSSWDTDATLATLGGPHRRAFPNSSSSPIFSTPRKGRPVSAYDTLTSSLLEVESGYDDEDQHNHHHNHHRLAGFRTRYIEDSEDSYADAVDVNGGGGGDCMETIRRAQSLDLAVAGLGSGQSSFDTSPNSPNSIDGKKANKLQYRLKHNLASKALKQASARMARWGSLLSREQ